MIVYSDNTATNLVLDASAWAPRPPPWKRWAIRIPRSIPRSFAGTRRSFPRRSKRFGLGSTTASEMTKLCKSLYHKELLTPLACEQMLDHLCACDDKDKFSRLLPPGTKIAFKTGSLADTRPPPGSSSGPRGPWHSASSPVKTKKALGRR